MQGVVTIYHENQPPSSPPFRQSRENVEQVYHHRYMSMKYVNWSMWAISEVVSRITQKYLAASTCATIFSLITVAIASFISFWICGDVYLLLDFLLARWEAVTEYVSQSIWAVPSNYHFSQMMSSNLPGFRTDVLEMKFIEAPKTVWQKKYGQELAEFLSFLLSFFWSCPSIVCPRDKRCSNDFQCARHAVENWIFMDVDFL